MLQEVLSATTMLSRDAGRTRFSSQATTQKALKQRMQAMLFAPRIAGDGHKYVAAHQGGKRYRTLHIRIETRASLHFDSIQQSYLGQELLSRRRLGSEYLLSKILEDVTL